MSDINVDEHLSGIGRRIKSLRRSAGLSQSNLGQTLGVTFQQVQKYESGRSKIAADKLQLIAKALDVDISYFYETASGVKSAEKPTEFGGIPASPEGKLFQESFDRIRDPRARYLLAELARVFHEIESGR